MRTQPTKSQPEAKTVTGSIPTVHAVYLLDRSGSMRDGYPKAKYVGAVQGINADIDVLKSQNHLVNYKLSIFEFDSGYDGVYKLIQSIFMKSINEVGRFTGAGPDGGTPLYQATGDVIKTIQKYKAKGEKVLLNIFTDGGENTSKGEFDPHFGGASKLKALIAQAEKDDDFTITFQGTKQDIKDIVDNVGIYMSNTLSHDNTFASIQSSSLTRGASLKSYSKSVAAGEDVKENFYTKTLQEQ